MCGDCVCVRQCGGSGMFIPDPGPGSATLVFETFPFHVVYGIAVLWITCTRGIKNFKKYFS
jgi:hypothetical protein